MLLLSIKKILILLIKNLFINCLFKKYKISIIQNLIIK